MKICKLIIVILSLLLIVFIIAYTIQSNNIQKMTTQIQALIVQNQESDKENIRLTNNVKELDKYIKMLNREEKIRAYKEMISLAKWGITQVTSYYDMEMPKCNYGEYGDVKLEFYLDLLRLYDGMFREIGISSNVAIEEENKIKNTTDKCKQQVEKYKLKNLPIPRTFDEK